MKVRSIKRTLRSMRRSCRRVGTPIFRQMRLSWHAPVQPWRGCMLTLLTPSKRRAMAQA